MTHYSKTNFGMSRRGFLYGVGAGGVAGLAGSSFALPASAQTMAKKGGILRFGLAGANTTDSLDPGLAWDDFMMLLTYGGLRNSLVELDADANPVADLAESWDSSADARVWTFKLRQGVEFHNGRSMTVDDVIASINHHRGPNSTSLAKSIFEQIEEVDADGELLRVTLAQGNVDFPILLSDYHVGIMPANDDGTVDWQSGLGTGGYVLRHFEAGVRAETTRFSNYWKEGRAHADEVHLIAINDVTARQNALLTGQIDAMNRVDLKTLSLLKRNAAVHILEVAGYQHATMPMLTNVAPFDNADLRKALKFSIDREQWVSSLLRGHGSVGNDHPIPEGQKFFNDELSRRAYDPDQAKFHLKAAGYDRIELDLSAADAAFAGAVDGAVLFRESAAAAGIDINVVREPNDGYWSNVWAKKPFCTCYWTGRSTPDAIFSLIYAEGASFGDTNWQNDRFNELLVAARTEFDEARRKDMYGEMQLLLNEDGGTVVPMFMNYVHGLSATVGAPEAVNQDMPLDGMKAMERWWIEG